jgi:hypothetical protein
MRFSVMIFLFSVPFASAAEHNWPLDVVTLKNGAKFEGLIVETLPGGLKFQVVKRPPGKPTLTFTTFIDKKEMADAKRLSDADRKILRERLAALDPNGRGERRRMDDLELGKVDWLGRKNAATTYEAEQFTLVSGTPEEITRRAAVRLDQIYIAFARFFPPRFEPARPTRVELSGDLEQYKQLLKATGGTVLNPAIFDPNSNRIVCGTDLRRLGDEMQSTRLHHLQQLAGVEKYEANVRELYKGSKPELDRFLLIAKKERDKIFAAEKENDRTFDLATRRLFAILYHEAFHSYVMNYVYPSRTPAEIRGGKSTGELPRWLNEGLAQVFENPVLEAGELRVGHADEERLKKIHTGLGNGGLVPLSDLLKAGKDAFIAAHAKEQVASDRTYLTSYSLAFYLMFERRLLGTTAFDEYLIALNTGAEPAPAFAKFVDQELPAFEKDWHDYLRRLQLDGSVKK